MLSSEVMINSKNDKISKKERERTHERLLEHKWVLDQEHERRFRRGMAAIMEDVLEFQRSNTMPAESGIGYKWKEGVDLNCVMAFREFFCAVRKDSTAIYSYLDPIDIAPVANRDEVHKMVKKVERRRKKRERKKADKKMKRETESRLNEESERLKAEWEAEATRNPMDELRETTNESQITPNSEASITPFPPPAETCTQEQDDEIARLITHLLYLREEKIVLGDIEDRDTRRVRKAVAAHPPEAVEMASELNWEGRGEVAAMPVGDEARSTSLSLSQDSLLDAAVTYRPIFRPSSHRSYSRSSSPSFHVRSGSLNIDDDTDFPPTLTPSVIPSSFFFPCPDSEHSPDTE